MYEGLFQAFPLPVEVFARAWPRTPIRLIKHTWVTPNTLTWAHLHQTHLGYSAISWQEHLSIKLSLIINIQKPNNPIIFFLHVNQQIPNEKSRHKYISPPRPRTYRSCAPLSTPHSSLYVHLLIPSLCYHQTIFATSEKIWKDKIKNNNAFLKRRLYFVYMARVWVWARQEK